MRGIAVALAGAALFNPATEAKNFSKTTERAAIYASPAAQVQLREVGTQNELAALQAQANDPERNPNSEHLRQPRERVRRRRPLLRLAARATGSSSRSCSRPATARRSRATSGRRAGPAKRPGVVITTGSVQAPERLYWSPRNARQGRLRRPHLRHPGPGPLRHLRRGADQYDGVPSQSGRPFYDGTEDALDFLLSTPKRPYVPRPSCTTGTSHAGEAGPPGRRRPQRRLQPARASSSTRAGSGSPATRSAPAPSPSSARSTPA